MRLDVIEQANIYLAVEMRLTDNGNSQRSELQFLGKFTEDGLLLLALDGRIVHQIGKSAGILHSEQTVQFFLDLVQLTALKSNFEKFGSKSTLNTREVNVLIKNY